MLEVLAAIVASLCAAGAIACAALAWRDRKAAQRHADEAAGHRGRAEAALRSIR